MSGVEVTQAAKPLFWRKPEDDGCGDPHLLEAVGIGGRYSISDEGLHYLLWDAADGFSFTEHDTVDAAKAAAEKDWQSTFARHRTRADRELVDIEGCKAALYILTECVEINPSNYTHEQVCELNAAVNEAHGILRQALACAGEA